jgi:drug/metabolite transporter (DMT)-like permease
VPTERRKLTKSKWYLPLVSVVLGGLMFVAQAIGGHPGQGAVSFAILAGVGLAVLLGGRSETIRGLRGDGRDERFAKMDIHATALAGMAIITAVIVAFLVEIAQGKDGMPYAWLGAIGGVAYIVAIVVFRLRS